MNELKLKHLDFIQAAISRMGQNSFLVKGWSATLTSALFALAAKDSDPNYGLISLCTIPVFWGLDGFFLATEKRFRRIFEDVAKKKEADIDFKMNPLSYKKGASVGGAIISKTLWPFHGSLLFAAIAVKWIVPALGKAHGFDPAWNFFFHREWL